MTVRGWLLAAMVAAASAPGAASAAVLVQYDTEAAKIGIQGFDATLGTLNAVTLDVSILKYRVWVITAPAGTLTPSTGAAIGWTVTGDWLLRATNFGTPALTLPLAGAGTSDVTFGSAAGTDYGYLQVAASGAGTLSFDPAAFVRPDRVYFDGFDYGFYGDPAGTTFSGIPAGARPIALSGACRLGSGGPVPPFNDEDACGSVRYTVTYDYTPVGAAVPEPATWATMMLGFGVAGVALRRRRAPRPA